MNAAATPDTCCPRCGSGFFCGAAGPAPCACTTLTLSTTLQSQLQARYAGCLCLNCLRELAEAETIDMAAAPAPRESP